MNLVSLEAGAWGTTIFWKQVGQEICAPDVVESAVRCWPQTGHANLNSLIATARMISETAGGDNDIYPKKGTGSLEAGNRRKRRRRMCVGRLRQRWRAGARRLRARETPALLWQ